MRNSRASVVSAALIAGFNDALAIGSQRTWRDDRRRKNTTRVAETYQPKQPKTVADEERLRLAQMKRELRAAKLRGQALKGGFGELEQLAAIQSH